MRRVPASMSGGLHRRAGYLLITTALPTIVAAAGLLLAPAAQADGCQPSGIGTDCSIAAGDSVNGLALTTSTDITSELDGTSSAPVDLVSAGGGGGEAQPGGTGGTITLDLSGTVDAAGADAVTIISQGGTGGDGADDGTLINAEPDPGGAGGNGGNVNASITGTIAATGDNASGLTAYSAGADGGTGGAADSAFGGAGADGGAGGTGYSVNIQVDAGARISTTGDNAYGIDAESFGGAGGAGGNRDGIGGDGGSGGPASGGGDVTIALTDGQISTTGQNSHGLLAQSIGGTGGNGAGSSGLFTGGGSGSAGADADVVTVAGTLQPPGTNQTPVPVTGTNITTTGDKSDAILAQSLGGGGGNGGDVTDVDPGIGVVIGGSAGPGGDGEQVSVTNWGTLTTGSAASAGGQPGGYLSDGILAQSVGGGGGNGGDAYNLGIGFFSMSIGGSGGEGGSAAAVTVDNQGGIVTQGDHAAGILAQSIGGGGGKGGSATSIDANGALSVSLALGATGGQGGGGSTVSATNDKGIITSGNDAYGMQVQSIGGGGGKGGTSLARSYSIAPPDPPVPAVSVSVGIGGSGGVAGSADQVQATNNGFVTTYGSGSSAIVAQSIGGGGGSGGSSRTTADAVSLEASLTASVSLGGYGGSAGDGGEVDVTNDGLLLTLGHDADGVFAQSVGGGGGLGAMGDSDGAGVIPLVKGVNASVTLGGSGGAGGSAGTVNVTNGSGILTVGSGSHGVFAHSVGGGGGRGTGGSADSDGDSLSIAVGVGGSGGNGSQGGAVTVTNNASILTMGSDAAGIVAQSVGGGGGWGGKVKAQAKASPAFGLFGDLLDKLTSGGNTSDNSDTLAEVADGDLGKPEDLDDLMDLGNEVASAENPGEAVADDNEWQNLTPLFADVDLDDDGADKAVSDAADSSDLDDVDSLDSAHDLNAATDGGEEGDGSEVELSLSISASVGGKGGSGGDAGEVNVTNAASLATLGDHSAGIFAQSVGGGGGHGGASSSTTATGNVSASVGVGGSGGASGDGGAVSVHSTGSLFTFGNHSHGIFAQSVGGGGGTGGAAGDKAGALLANVGVSVGGSGGASGAGGKITVQHDDGASIATFGDFAVGILAQSVGGGGGVAALVQSGSIDAGKGGDADGGSTPVVGADAFSPSLPPLSLSFGGSGGSTGSAAAVDITSSGDVLTYGHGGHGIMAQSIGGGGGAILGGAATNSAFFSNTDFGSGASSGDGSTVDVEIGGLVRTVGDGAVGVLAQSIGGGGGLIGDLYATDLTNAVAPTTGDGQSNGSGGAVTVTVDQNAQILTLGDHSYGIIAQSVAGGGGLGANASPGMNYLEPASTGSARSYGQPDGNGTAGGVTVAINGTTAALGDASWAVYAQSSGQTSDPITVSIANGINVVGGRNGGGGIYLSQGAMTSGSQNSVTNNGTLITAAGISGTAVAGDSGNNFIDNNGTITGSIELGTGIGQVTNEETGTINAGPTIDLGGHQPIIDTTNGEINPVGNYVLLNKNELNIGGTGVMQTTSLNGDYNDDSIGYLQMDVDFANKQGDLLQVQGNVALDGSMSINPISLQQEWVTVLTAGALGPVSQILLLNEDAYLFGFNYQVVDQSLQVMPQANFTEYSSSLTTAEQAVANHLQAAWNSDQPSDMGEGFVQLFAVGDLPEYASALDSLSAQTGNAVGNTQQASSQNFVANMNSCPAFEDAGTTLREQDCGWGRLIAGGSSLDSSGSTLGYDLRTTTIQFGGQKSVAPDWFVGGSIAYENANLDDDAGSGGVQGDSVLAGVMVKRQVGNWLVSGGADAGYGWYDSSRAIVSGGTASFVTGSPRAQHAGLHSRVSYQAPFNGWYVKPFVDLHAVYTRTSSFTESGPSSLRLEVDAEDELRFSVAPMLEIGGRIDAGEGRGLRPYLNLGAEFYDDRDWASDARFAGAPDEAGSFRAETQLPEQVAKLGVGVDMTASEHMQIKLEYTGELGDDYQSHAGTLRFTYLFN